MQQFGSWLGGRPVLQPCLVDSHIELACSLDVSPVVRSGRSFFDIAAGRKSLVSPTSSHHWTSPKCAAHDPGDATAKTRAGFLAGDGKTTTTAPYQPGSRAQPGLAITGV